MAENKNKNKKNNINSFAALEDPDDDASYEHGDLDDEKKSYLSLTPEKKSSPKSTSKKYTTPGANQIPVSTPFQVLETSPTLPQGHTWTQFRDPSGDILWRDMPTPAPPGTGHSSSSGTSSSTPVNLSQNFHNQGFTAPPGCLQFHRPT